jgi:hypothetical protein
VFVQAKFPLYFYVAKILIFGKITFRRKASDPERQTFTLHENAEAVGEP